VYGWRDWWRMICQGCSEDATSIRRLLTPGCWIYRQCSLLLQLICGARGLVRKEKQILAPAQFRSSQMAEDLIGAQSCNEHGSILLEVLAAGFTDA
jgi:hypothetical protein